MKHHAEQFTKEGDSLRMNSNHSISIKNSYCGYQDFANGEKGNSIDFLCRHLGYSFEDAVKALNSDEISYSFDTYDRETGQGEIVKTNELPNFPKPSDSGDYRAKEILRDYRGISWGVLEHWDYTGKIYLGGKFDSDLVFKSADNTWGEVWNYRNGYHGIVANSRRDGYFSFACPQGIEKRIYNNRLYICESSIDAISLLQVLLENYKENKMHACYYAGIGGAGKQTTIDRLIGICRQYNIAPVIAMDNDDAGYLAYARNKETCEAFFPPKEFKDWNDVVQGIRKKEYRPIDLDKINGINNYKIEEGFI